MTTMWLVCLSLLVAADAASLGPRAVDIPVQIVYQETPVKSNHGKHAGLANEADAHSHGHTVSLKNLDEKSQLSAEEVVEAAVLNIPAGIIKISDEVSVAKAPLDVKASSSEESREIPEESNSQESNEINNELTKQPIVLDIPIAPVNVEPIILKEGEQEKIIEQLTIAEDAPIAAAPTIVEVVEQLVEEVPITPVVNEEPTLLEVGQDIVAVDNDVPLGKSVPESAPDGVLIVEFPNDEPQSVEEEQKIEPQVLQEAEKLEPQVLQEAEKLEPEIVQEVQNLPPLVIEQEVVTPEKDVAKGKSVPVATPEVILDEKVEPELVAEVQNTEPEVVPEVQNIEPSIVSQTLEEVKNTPALENVQNTVPIAEVKPEELPLEADPVLKVQLREANPEPAVQAAAPANQIVEEAPPASPKPTTQKPASGPLAGIQNAINRLGETVGLRPTNAPTKADAEPVAATGAPPTMPAGFQQNINNQLTNFGNQVNGFIDNLRPKPPVAAATVESDEAVTPAPNTPFLNFVQTQFNNGLTALSNTVNTTLNNQQAATQSDEAAPAPAAGPFQQIFNGAAQLQSNVINTINTWNQQQQSDEAQAPQNANIGQQIIGFISNGITSFTQNLGSPPAGGNVQGDEVVPQSQSSGPLSGITNAFSNIGQQWSNFVTQSGNVPQGIPTQITQGSNPLTQLPGVSQLQGQIPSASQLQGQIPGGPQLQQGAQQIATLIPGSDQLPGATLLTPTPVLPASTILTTTSQN